MPRKKHTPESYTEAFNAHIDELTGYFYFMSPQEKEVLLKQVSRLEGIEQLTDPSSLLELIDKGRFDRGSAVKLAGINLANVALEKGALSDKRDVSKLTDSMSRYLGVSDSLNDASSSFVVKAIEMGRLTNGTSIRNFIQKMLEVDPQTAPANNIRNVYAQRASNVASAAVQAGIISDSAEIKDLLINMSKISGGVGNTAGYNLAQTAAQVELDALKALPLPPAAEL